MTCYTAENVSTRGFVIMRRFAVNELNQRNKSGVIQEIFKHKLT